MRGKTGDRRNVSKLFDEWRSVNVRSAPSFFRLWRGEGFVNKSDDYADDRPLGEVSHSLSRNEFQPDVQVHVVVQHKCANHENAPENSQARTFFSARSAGMLG